jgi:MFS family permease
VAVARPKLLVDITPLRRSRDFRILYAGQMVSFLGSQLTVVAIPYQVFRLTHSSLDVGLVSMAQLVPLVIGSMAGGAIADSRDRRSLLMVTLALLAVAGIPLAVNAGAARPALWPIVVFSALAAGLSGLERPARSAVIPVLVPVEELTGAYALWQILIQVGSVVGPALAGLLLAGVGLTAVYLIDVVTFLVAVVAVSRLRPLPPEGGGTKAGLGSIAEGLRFLKGRPVLQGGFLADIDAMVFGMPRALFPALATGLYGGGAATLGLLYAAPGAGALIGALLTGWVNRVRRQGRAVVIAVACWGLFITAFGVTPWLPLGLVFLALAGASDVVSAVFRNTILQTATPDALRGRLSATHIAVVTGGPRLGDLEAGAVASISTPQVSVVTGGLACIAGIALLAWRLPAFARFDVLAEAAVAPGPAEEEEARS